MSILKLESLSYSYDGNNQKILNDINFEFEKGKIYAIIGKSGAGKSTLLSVLSGLTTPTEGKILYDGKDIKKIDKYQYRSRMVGVIFQGYNLLPQLTAQENVVLSLDVSGKKLENKNEIALNMLSNLELDETKSKRRVLKLSGGEQQRVAIARALSYNPDIILADEPTGNLDKDTEEGIMKIFLELARQQDKCVIIVTHSSKVATFADKKIMIANGKFDNNDDSKLSSL
ncbi:ABC transporter ATP-binding protein [Clostridium sp. CM028]|uniref:ABC transporter ATP-binding protein n=1 Tax=unclassified Clostridium TaxID=2614128 RepID=UPI001C0C02A8|nr:MULTISPECIES: ABC transporter ATP-binding protein [unclassified Clostridium]MBU3092528.1 ABC transporter ATP-binding protein [Clostridium sp. CF011]MBW9146355.1 ABC transporter ATP-binding protein [Clostridium sp. CM027]MBW9150044.1 ABC transporter ATP-binding protein [Clostridium sp. CM028]UVE39867.1 ABC transporter ATP-binding protein [Clostridium sp. CM027]WAG68783.1 ABC transporter ATP-binding protein [Clostridium sp. CF011]